MPSSNLFAVSNQGRVFALRTDSTKWEELPYLGIDFKRVSAHDAVVWALGGDHQVYVYVYGTSVPIRVCEEAYENQRWNPLEGFTSNLLPSDRPVFSSIDGLEGRQLSDIHLPSLAWNWEGPWHLQDTFEGKALDKECWTYAVDFPRHYVAEKSWKSCVRRRKWVRYRRYIALDTWSAVSSIHKDHTEEPFIDIAVGGGDVIGEDPDKLMLWAITAFGKVAVREGICSTCPEGTKWTFVKTPAGQDVICLSVGRSGRVWALTWDGTALVRSGVSRDHPLGLGWNVVESPGSPMSQIAVGSNVVWAVCRDYTLWFRRGLDDTENNDSSNQVNHNYCQDNSYPGTSWLKMIGFFSMISVGPNDQVWGIINEDHSLAIRTGVTSSELTGKTWKVINLPLQRFDPDKHNPEEDLYDQSSASDDNSQKDLVLNNSNLFTSSLIKGSSCSLNDSESQDALSMNTNVFGSETSSGQETSSSSCHLKDQSMSIDTLEKSNESLHAKQESFLAEQYLKSKESATESSENISLRKGSDPIRIGRKSYDEQISSSDFNNLSIKNPEDVPESMTSSVISDTIINFIGSDYPREDYCSKILSSSSGKSDVVFEENKSVRSLYEDHLHQSIKSDHPFHSSTSSINSEIFVPTEGSNSIIQDEPPIYKLMLQEENLWVWVSGSGCWVQPNNMPKWFIADYASLDFQEPWRHMILEKLLMRKKREKNGFDKFPESIECSSWVVNGQSRILIFGQWVPATLELQMSTCKFSKDQEANLKIIYTMGSKKTMLLPCSSIVLCALTVNLPAKALVSLFTPASALQPVPLLFSAEKDAEQWLSNITSASVQHREVEARPSPHSIWTVSSLGFIYFHDPVAEKKNRGGNKPLQCTLDVGDGSVPFLHQLDKGFRPGFSITVKGKIHEGARRFQIDLLLDDTLANIALHVNPRFNDKIVVMNTREHNVWSYEERELLRSFTRGRECQVTILCDHRDIKISVNEKHFYSFTHRVMASSITHISVAGDITLSDVLYSCGTGDPTPREYFWRGIGGHLRVVETGFGGVTWGLSYDAHVYIYTGVYGGGVYEGNANDPNIYVMSDIRNFYVWENQRWNPLTGFTYRGLPTDRKTWSDQSGKYEITKEGTKLPSRHWQWMGDWAIDHHTPNGVDKDGWQYATDFPMSYHAHRYVTDLVRRRRWVRKCRISTSGPWKQMEKVALISISVSPNHAENGTVPVWGVSVSNEVVMREGVTPQSPRGTRWCLIPSETPMKEICASIEGGIWAVSDTGQAHLRIGVTKSNPKGYDWVNIDAPNTPLKQISMGSYKVWALDREGTLYYRVNVQPLFPEGTSWQQVCTGVESISATIDGALWAVLHSFSSRDEETRGVIARRIGISSEVPGGTGWDMCAGIGWSNISARTFL